MTQAQMAEHVNSEHLDYLSPSKKLTENPKNDKALNGNSSDDNLHSPRKRRKSELDLFDSSSESLNKSTSQEHSDNNDKIDDKKLPSDDLDKSPVLSCPMCPFTDSNTDSLERHVNTHLDDPDEPPQTDLSCPFCSVAFPTSLKP